MTHSKHQSGKHLNSAFYSTYIQLLIWWLMFRTGPRNKILKIFFSNVVLNQFYEFSKVSSIFTKQTLHLIFVYFQNILKPSLFLNLPFVLKGLWVLCNTTTGLIPFFSGSVWGPENHIKRIEKKQMFLTFVPIKKIITI